MLSAFILFSLVRESCQREPPSFPGLLTVNELMARGGYQTTPIEVITEDGYSLWMYRLGNNSGPPLIMHHGVFVACESWITRGPHKDLAFYLLEEGYDVWLTNQRGTAYNEYNLRYKRSDPRYWNFSFHEAGLYDLPAFIDRILQIRGTEQLLFIGHSLGTTTFLAMASTRVEYNSKIALAILLSPVAFTPSAKERGTLLSLVIPNAGRIYYGGLKLGIYEILPRTPTLVTFLKNFCGYESNTQSLCLYLIGLYLGSNKGNVDRKDFGFHMPFFSGGTSAKTTYHTTQLYQSGEFKQFDYGGKDNLAVYGSKKPPLYSIGSISAPVALYWSYNDPLLSENSVNQLASRLPQLVFSKPVPDPKFTHSDMYLGKNADIVLYPDIINLLNSFTY